MNNVTVFCFLASYFVAFVLEMSRLLRRTKMSRAVILLFTAAGLVAHTIYLLSQSHEAGLPPLLSSTKDWLLVLTWIAMVAYLLLALFHGDLAIGQFVLPIVLVLVGVSYLVSESTNSIVQSNLSEARAKAIRPWAMLHASFLLFAMVGVVSGFVLSIMYLVQHRRLKKQEQIMNNLKLPSLATLQRWNRWAVMASVLLLTLGMAFGVVLGLYSDKGTALVSFKDPVVVVSAIVWLVTMVFFIWFIRTNRGEGKSVAWQTLWAFGFLLVTLIALQVMTGKGSFSLDTWHTGFSTKPDVASGIFMREEYRA